MAAQVLRSTALKQQALASSPLLPHHQHRHQQAGPPGLAGSSISRLVFLSRCARTASIRACCPQPAHSRGLFLAQRWKFAIAAASSDALGFSDTRLKGAQVAAVSEEQDKQANDAIDASQLAENSQDGPVDEMAGLKDSAVQSTEKLIGVLRDTTEQLKEQAEKAKAALAATAQETAEKSKENLSYIAENAPDPIKDIAETALKAHSPDNPKKGAKIHDFCLGIPYGSFLVIGGLLWFIISGSTAAIRFGVILGGALLGLSVSSLKVWKKGESSMAYIKGQAAITLIIMLREIRRFFEVKTVFPTAFLAIISAAMFGFYSYVYLSGGNPPKKSKTAPAA